MWDEMGDEMIVSGLFVLAPQWSSARGGDIYDFDDTGRYRLTTHAIGAA